MYFKLFKIAASTPGNTFYTVIQYTRGDMCLCLFPKYIKYIIETKFHEIIFTLTVPDAL